MLFLLQKIPFLVELFFNGTFILLSSLKRSDRLPGSWDIHLIDTILGYSVTLIPVVLFFVIAMNYLSCSRLDEFLRKYIFSIIVFIPIILTWGDLEFSFWLSSIHLLSSILNLYDNDDPFERKSAETFEEHGLQFLKRLRFSPAQVVLFSFICVIFIGTFLLMLPISSAKETSLSFIDAFFTSTSATCVTGLSTLSLKNDFSPVGQFFVLLLIQIGGLGFMILYSSMAIFLGRSLDMKERLRMQNLLDIGSLEELFVLIVDIVKFTFLIELWGALLLTVGFVMEGFEFTKALWLGIFHSISAFCNAGFSLFDNSMESFANNPLMNFTLTSLIIVGGLGFIVLKELKEIVLTKKNFVRWRLHTKIVISSNIILIALAFTIIFFGEFLNALDDYSLFDKVQIAFFQSVTLRTAGFNTIPLDGLHNHILYIMTLFMYIGASPGSTGGGIKVTTFAILSQSIRSMLRGRDKVELFDRTIPQSIVVKSTALTIILISVATFFIFLLMQFESQQTFLAIFFEVASAIGTVGLSLGITPYLSILGKVAISFLMFIGRVGPLTLVLAVGQDRNSRGRLNYPDGKIMIG